MWRWWQAHQAKKSFSCNRTQQKDIDYNEPFSLVVRFASIRFILALVATIDLELHQMDVKTAFLKGELNKEISMVQPESFLVPISEHKVWELRRSIYGLKQSSRKWYIRFHEAIISFDFKMIDEDHYVYLKRLREKFVILTSYVDDILIVGNDLTYFKSVKD